MNTPVDTLALGISQSSRVALAKAITLVESTRADHRQQAEQLFLSLKPTTHNTLRIAVSGSPGVGKSSFIESFGLHVINSGKKLAVLAIDPSSPVTGGSILGDKTRMEELSKSEKCFIRPSPSSGYLGGVARHTRESIILCEAAGFDVIIVETVGIGQSEVLAASMTDFFLQLHQPMSGDELQGIKKGVMELADIVVITKADGASESAAKLAKVEIERALLLTRIDHNSLPPVFLSSNVTKSGYDLIWSGLCNLQTQCLNSGKIAAKRKSQNKEWLQHELGYALLDYLMEHPRFESQFEQSLNQVIANHTHCAATARLLVKNLLSFNKSH